MWPFKRKTQYQPVRVYGFPPPKPRVVYSSHRLWAGASTITRALDGIAEDIKNEASRHCRIGKITVKG